MRASGFVGAGAPGAQLGVTRIAALSIYRYTLFMAGSPIIDKLTQFRAQYFPHLASDAMDSSSKPASTQEQLCDSEQPAINFQEGAD